MAAATDSFTAAVERLVELADAATPGPWVHEGLGYGAISSVDPETVTKAIAVQGADAVLAYQGACVGESMEMSDREFIVACRDLVSLLASAYLNLVRQGAF